MTKKAEVITFGCRLNIYESEILKQGVKEHKIKDTAIFNSCAVTSESVRQVKQSIRKRKREFPNDKIIVTGCAAQIEPETFSSMSEVDLVSGNIEKRNIANLISSKSINKIEVRNIMENQQELNGLVDGYDNRSRAFIEIQNGCDHRCTFCIIPYGRGNSISKSVKNIINEINLMLEKGHKEIVLTGVDIASWGYDLDKKSNIGFLVKKILKGCPKLMRLKLSSMDVIGFDDELLEIITTESRVLPHIHLSLQAGDDMILKRMKRRHLRADAIEFCTKMRMARPDIIYGADIIAGFPTETEKMFENSLKLIEDCNLTWLHIFPFSPRQGTPAALMPQMDRSIIKERAGRLRARGDIAVQKHLEMQLGIKHKVLMENNRMGRTEGFTEVLFSSDKLKGVIVDAKSIERTQTQLIAE